MKSPLGRLFAVALVALVGCNGSTVVTDAGTDGGSDVQSSDVVGDTGFVCPADPRVLEGQACTTEGQSCGTCGDVCSFCNLMRCEGGHWQHIEVFPGPCDGGVSDGGEGDGSIDGGAADAGGVACGTMTCNANEICVHSVRTGGACRMPEDGGCGPGERLAGSCCVAYSETFQCALPPIACESALSCGCAESLCGDPGTGCPCQSASGSTLECACFFP